MGEEDAMDDYASLTGPSIIMPPGGKVSGLSAKRKMDDRKKQKRDGKEKREKGGDDVVIHGQLREPSQNREVKSYQVVKGTPPENEDNLILYGKRHRGKRQKSKIDVMI